MAGLNHQVQGELDLFASAARCPERAILSDHSNQDEKSDLGQESDAHDGDRQERRSPREGSCHASHLAKPRGVNPSGLEIVSAPNADGNTSGAGIRGGLRRRPLRANR